MAKEEWMDDSDFIEEEKADMLPEETPEQGVVKMETWLRILTKRETAIRTGKQFESDEPARDKALIQIGREIMNCRQRLEQYKAQRDGRN